MQLQRNVLNRLNSGSPCWNRVVFPSINSHWKIRHGLYSVTSHPKKLVAFSNTEQSSSSGPNPAPAEAAEADQAGNSSESNLLQSWSDENGSSSDDTLWETKPVPVDSATRYFKTNAVFSVTLGVLALIAYFILQKFSTFRRNHPLPEAPSASQAVLAESSELLQNEEEADSFAVDELPDAVDEQIVEETNSNNTETKAGQDQLPAEIDTPEASMAAIAEEDEAEESSLLDAEISAEEKGQELNDAVEDKKEPSSSSYLLPLRSSEAEAALAKLQAKEERRMHLYDRVEQKQKERYDKLTQGKLDSTEYENTAARIPPLAAELWSDHDDELTPLEIPQGMSYQALRTRAEAANTAAAAAATAARKAAASSAMAAEAADAAIHLAQKASQAAEQCAVALDAKALDRIENSYTKAIEADEAAALSAQKAAIYAAKASQQEHDAKKQAKRAEKAAELSSPHTLREKLDFSWKQVRRGASTAIDNTKHVASVAVEHGKAFGEEGLRHGKVVKQNLDNAWHAFQKRISTMKK